MLPNWLGSVEVCDIRVARASVSLSFRAHRRRGDRVLAAQAGRRRASHDVGMTSARALPRAPESARFEAIVLRLGRGLARSTGPPTRRASRGLVEDGCAIGLELGWSARRTSPKSTGSSARARRSRRSVAGAHNESSGPIASIAMASHPVHAPAAADEAGYGRWIMGCCGGAASRRNRSWGRARGCGGLDRVRGSARDQIERRRRGELPIVDPDPTWTLPIDGADPLLERAQESMLTIADGRLGTRGSVVIANPSDDPGSSSPASTTASAPTRGCSPRRGGADRRRWRWQPTRCDASSTSRRRAAPGVSALPRRDWTRCCSPRSSVRAHRPAVVRSRTSAAGGCVAAPVGLTAPLAITTEAARSTVAPGCVSPARAARSSAAVDDDVRDEPAGRGRRPHRRLRATPRASLTSAPP